MNNGQKPVHANAGEEEHAAVHVGVKQRDGELAEYASERPVLVDEVENPQGQSEDEEQVGHHQINHVGCGLVPQLQRAGEDVYGDHVGDQTHYKHDAEDRAVQRVFEAVVFGAGGAVFCPWQRNVVGGEGVVVHSESEMLEEYFSTVLQRSSDTTIHNLKPGSRHLNPQNRPC